jgi:hypothetical protein
MSFMDRDLVSGTPVREDRRARLVRGSLRLSDGTVIPIVVRNLSERGLGVTCKGGPPLRGQAVIVTLPGTPELDGVVRWTRGNDFGVELTGLVDAEELATAIRREIARMKEAGDWVVSSRHRVRMPHTTGPRRRI